MAKLLEIACYNIDSAIKAAKAGANRIELCENHFEGGTTPSYGTTVSAVETLNIPVNVIIRPRGGDFVYSGSEFDVMKKDIKTVKQAGANGIVTGILNENGTVDFERMKEIIELARPMEITFHRAFDVSRNPWESLEVLLKLGVDRLLTSGMKPSAAAGTDLIAEMINKTNGKIIIMPGGGIRPDNLKKLALKTGATEFHSSAISFIKGKNTGKKVKMGDNDNDDSKIVTVDEEVIREMIKILKSF